MSDVVVMGPVPEPPDSSVVWMDQLGRVYFSRLLIIEDWRRVIEQLIPPIREGWRRVSQEINLSVHQEIGEWRMRDERIFNS